MSLKTFKNKKESTVSKPPNSRIESGSAPFSKLLDESILPRIEDNDVARKPNPDFNCSEEMDDVPVPPLRQNSEDEYDGCNKVSVYFDTFAKAIIKVFS
jgi:hypothetical protein